MNGLPGSRQGLVSTLAALFASAALSLGSISTAAATPPGLPPGFVPSSPPVAPVVRATDERSGDLIVYEPRPVLADELRACSFRHPLCVHASSGRAGKPRAGVVAKAGGATDEVLAWLDAADRAWDTATGALDLPGPDASLESGALDLYLVPGEPEATRTLLDRRDVVSGFDRASAFALVGSGAHRGCGLDAAAARVVARAILFRVAPATDSGSALAESASQAKLIVACAPRLDTEIGYFQDHPEVGLADPLAPTSESVAALNPGAPLVSTASELYGRGASLFYDWLDARFGGYPGATLRALWALRPTLTPVGAARWNDEPDGFDVLRTTFKDALRTGSTIDDLWLDFAVARAFVPGLPVRVEWSVAWPQAPRTLLSGWGVAPTGAAYVSVDCAKRPPGARLRFEAHWEEHARILWTLVRVDGAGHEMSRIAVPGPERGTDAQTTLVDLDGTARVLIVGSSAGDPLILFDPDDYRWETHGWTVSLGAE